MKQKKQTTAMQNDSQVREMFSMSFGIPENWRENLKPRYSYKKAMEMQKKFIQKQEQKRLEQENKSKNEQEN